MRALLDVAEGRSLTSHRASISAMDRDSCLRRIDIADGATSVRPCLSRPRLAGDHELKGIAIPLQCDAEIPALAGSQDQGFEEQEVPDFYSALCWEFCSSAALANLQRCSPWEDGLSSLNRCSSSTQWRSVNSVE